MKKSKTKIFALAMAAALVMSLTLPASAAQFPDMPTGWSKDAMQAAVDAGLFEGTEDGKINPTGELTRAELAKVIATAFGASVEADLSAYTDVNGSWYTQPMARAVKMGVINGTGATSMSPTRKVTRQEAATILARALKLADGTAEDLAAFSDADQIGSWFVGPMAAMVKAGYLNGSDGKLNPTQIMTRESLAVMMYNIFTTYIQKSGEVTEVPEGNVMVSAPDVTLKGVKITGDLIIGDGVGEGDVIIDNCTIGGGVIVRGGGVNSVRFISTTVTKTVIVTKTTGPVRVYSDSESTVATSVVSASGAVTLEGTFTTVEVATSEAAVEAKNVTAETVSVTAAEAQVTMTDSTVATVAVTAANTTVALANTTATTVTVAQAANLEMTGETKVTTMAVTSENVVVAADTDVVITTVQTDVTVVITGEPTIENPVEGSGEITDTPPEPDPEPSESTEPEPAESGDPTDVGVVETPAPHVHTLVWQFIDGSGHWQVCTADGHVDDGDFTDGKTNAGEHDANGPNGTCSKCGYGSVVTGGELTEDHASHTFAGDGTVTKSATCTTAGTKTWTCSCGATKTETIPATGHTFTEADDYKVSAQVDATCSTAGKTAVYHCHDCDATTGGAVIPATNHSGNTNTTKDKYQHSDQNHWLICSVCGAQIQVAAHVYDNDDDMICNTCDAVRPSHTHQWSEWTYDGDNAGNHKRTCTGCGTVERQACSGSWTANGANHELTCSVCEHKQSEAHTWASDGSGNCTKCDATCGHSGTKDTTHTDIVKGKDCQTVGTWTVVVKCRDCGHVMSSTPNQEGDDTTKGDHHLVTQEDGSQKCDVDGCTHTVAAPSPN